MSRGPSAALRWFVVGSLMVALGACRPAASAADVIHLRIVHSRFVPALFAVRAGSTVRIVVRNDDPIDHELIVGDRATQDSHESGVEAHHDGSVPGEVSVAAGTQVTTTYPFGHAGPLLYGCHLPGHWAYGMRGSIRLRHP